ncbi:MAG TPA: SdiA-regulated domain-containing protein [Flavitalea sp.]|nr:SdiA-regulated domain-containing protein [Flavitalea sp.]
MLLNPCQHIVDKSVRIIRLAVIPVTICVLLVSCSLMSGRSFKPKIEGYNEKHATMFVLSKKLLEISGQVSFSDHYFVAINDEKGELIKFGLGKNDKTSTEKFAGKGDYEDIVNAGPYYYVLESTGDLYRVDTGDARNAKKYKFKLEKKIEFESLVYYKQNNKLILITKDHGLKNDAIIGYSFDLASGTFDHRPFFTISRRTVLRKMKDYSAEFKPSAAAIHPKTGKLFILASIGKQLIICSPNGDVENAYDLNPDHFPQPEGISFASNGDMYISNEGLHGKATILKYKYEP